MRGNGSIIEESGPAAKAECRGMSANVLQSEKCTPSCSAISASKMVMNKKIRQVTQNFRSRPEKSDEHHPGESYRVATPRAIE